MRQITAHRNHSLNSININAIRPPVPGMPSYRYDVSGFSTVYNDAASDEAGHPSHFTYIPIILHHGPLIADEPQNGLTIPTLLAIIADHLQDVQRTPDACLENQMALDYTQAALAVLTSKPEPVYSSQRAYSHTV